MLERITVENGFYTDLGLSLIALDPRQKPEEGAIYTAIASSLFPTEDASSRTVRSTMEIVIETTLPFELDENPELLAHRARADIVSVIRNNFRNQAIGITSLVVTGSQLSQPEDGAAAVIAQVTARAGLTETQLPAKP